MQGGSVASWLPCWSLVVYVWGVRECHTCLASSESFVISNPLMRHGAVSREDECRLLFLSQSSDHTRILQLLHDLVNRPAGDAGKRPRLRPGDISDSLSFALHGLPGAFSGPNKDALGGTYIHVLSGHRFWITCPNMTDAQDEAFQR